MKLESKSICDFYYKTDILLFDIEFPGIINYDIKKRKGRIAPLKPMTANCETCAYFEYDEDEEEYFCSMNMDEDDYARLISSDYKDCKFYRNGDEYAVVKHQI